MTSIGDTITVSREEAKALRKQGWMPRGDIVTMMYVGKPQTLSNRLRANRFTWSIEDHAFAARKLAEART